MRTEGMVLDEKALEAMLARQRASEREQGIESVRTERTDEFEVYERADGQPRTGAGVRAPQPTRSTAIPPSRPLVPADDPPARPRAAIPPSRPLVPAEGADDFEELPGREPPTEFQPPPAFQEPSPAAPEPSPAATAAPSQADGRVGHAAPAPQAHPDGARHAPRDGAIQPPEPRTEPAQPGQDTLHGDDPPDASPRHDPPVEPRPSASSNGHGAHHATAAEPAQHTEPAPRRPSAQPAGQAPRHEAPHSASDPRPLQGAPRSEATAPPTQTAGHATPAPSTAPDAGHDAPAPASSSNGHLAPEPSMPEEAAPRRRPQVWPPIARREEPLPEAAAATTGAAPDESAPNPEPEPEAPATPEPDAPAASEERPRTHAPTPHAFPATGAAGNGCRIAVVQAEFNAEITDMMAQLAVAHAQKAGAEVAHHVKVPGVYDLPLTVQRLARRKDVDAVVVIGCVVQGETKHDELITHATAKTLQEVSLATETPIGLGIIGPGMTWEQAEARVVNGKHAVEAVLAQWSVLRQG